MIITDLIALESRDAQQEQAYAEAYQEIWESGYEKGLMGLSLAAGETNCDFLDGYIDFRNLNDYIEHHRWCDN